LDEEAKWGDTLDWRTNEYDFYRLTRSILDRLDSEYRKKWGLRVDQLARAEDVQTCFRTYRACYEKEQELFRRAGIYVFLQINLDLWLGGKACEALDSHREEAQKTIA
jgi:hypothetical protein